MLGSLDRIMAGLRRAPGESERRVLQRVFGPLRFVHLRRVDTVAQAVSWCRAEQTGYWQDCDVALGSSNLDLDLDRMKNLVGRIRDHNDSWQDWFTRNRIEPLAVTYEEVV